MDLDAAGALYICDQLEDRSALAAIPVDNASLDNGCTAKRAENRRAEQRTRLQSSKPGLADRGGALRASGGLRLASHNAGHC